MRLLLIMFICLPTFACATAAPGENDTKDSELQDQFIARFNSLEGSKETRSRDAELKRIVEEYYSATVRVAEKARKAWFVVVDEAGNELKDVKVEITRAHTVGLLAMREQVDREDRVESGPFAVDWLRDDEVLAIKFSKANFRSPVSIAFRARKRKLEERLDRSLELLTRGFLREPAVEGGPMRVVMPPSLMWPPETRYDIVADRVPGGLGKNRPKTVKPVEDPVASTDGPVCHMTTRRGTYVAVDRSGKVVAMYRFDRGAILSAERVITDTGTPEIRIYFDPGGGRHLPVAADTEPYQWQLFAEPVPPPPEEKPKRG